MAHVDLQTGKIYGTKKGSKTYWHEVGHLKFEDECKIGNKIRVLQDLSMKTLIYATALGVVNPLAVIKAIIVILILGHAGLELYEERWCWNYAQIKLSGKKTSDERIKKNSK